MLSCHFHLVAGGRSYRQRRGRAVGSTDLISLLTALSGRKVVVVGDALLDVYVRGMTSGLCREAPVPVLTVGSADEVPGAAANVAANVAALGATATLVAAVGDDDAGHRLIAALRRMNVGTEHVVVVQHRQTVVKRRVVADGQTLVRLDEGTAERVDGAIRSRLRRRLDIAVPTADAVVVCDYGHGIVTGEVVEALRRARSRTQVLVLDAKDPRAHRSLRPTVVKPNYAEAMHAMGLHPVVDRDGRMRQVLENGTGLLDTTGAEMAVVTLDADGAVLFERGRQPFRSSGGQRPGPVVVGAGDAFVAALALSFATGADPPAATELASIAAATADDAAGTAVCSMERLNRALGGGKLLTFDAMTKWAAATRALGRRIVLTNGCFDLLHEGHVVFLSQAKSLGDVLVVGVNDDASVSRLKGRDRPVVDVGGRIQVLSALSCVDQVVVFGGDTAEILIDRLRPDVYVKGGDYTIETLPEAGVLSRVGARVHFLDYVPQRSSTRIIERIQSQL